MKQRALRTTDELWERVKVAAGLSGQSVNEWLVRALEGSVGLRPTVGANAPQAGEERDRRFSSIVKQVGATGGYPYHPYEKNIKRVLVSEDWVTRWKLPFTDEDIVAACYVAGEGDPWAGFIYGRVREQLNDALEGVGSRPAVLRSRIRALARITP